MKILVALGGNAILRPGSRGTAGEQLATVDLTCSTLLKMIAAGHDIAVTHGNGPQVGDILLANEMARGIISPMPLDVCGAESQGMIGYMIQQSLENGLRRAGLEKRVVTILTQTAVNPSDRAFGNPSKPIGPYFEPGEANRLKAERQWTMIEEPGRGFRRVVPSPDPVEIIESEVIKSLFAQGVVVISTGGGGVPVVRDAGTGRLRGVEAVIDKDLGAALLASFLEVDLLMILTDVDGVCLDYGKPGQRLLRRMSAVEGRRYLLEGQFPPGSMGPKIEAALKFVESMDGRAIITSIEKADSALEGEAGTLITRS